MADEGSRTEGNWERGVIEKLALEALKEQRRARRWGIFFKLLAVRLRHLVLVIALDWGAASTAADKHTALVEVERRHRAEGRRQRGQHERRAAGGVQGQEHAGRGAAHQLPGRQPGAGADHLRRDAAAARPASGHAALRVVEDICASGGYYVAVGADKIYVDKASLVGSIGVLMDSFGFTGPMDKLGVERRLFTAGENKGLLDPFSPLEPRQVEHAKELLGEIHQQFIDVVRKGRGKRLKESPELFSGLIWTGAKSIELGLADGFGSLDYVAREVIKAEEIVDYTQKENVAERLAKRFGAGAAAALGLGSTGPRLR